MTTEEKLEKLKKLADAMYYAAQYLTTDASSLRKTMEDYRQFIINEYHNEEPKPKFKVGDRIKFKGIHNEDVTRVITNIQKGEGGGFRYFFADGSIYSIGGDEIELVEEPVSEEIWEASKQYALRQVLASTDTEMSEQAYLDLRLFSGFELAVAHKDGAQWREDQMMKKAVDAHCFGFQGAALFSFKLPAGNYLVGSKVKVIVIKEDLV